MSAPTTIYATIQPAIAVITAFLVAQGQPGSISNSTYLAPFAGAVSRSAISKLSDIVSLLDFPGADPTGTTDSGPALRLALAGLPNGVGTILVPAGIYKISTPVVLNAYQSIVGAGTQATIFVAGANTITMFDTNQTGTLNNNINLADFAINNPNSLSGITGIRLTKASFAALDNLYSSGLNQFLTANNASGYTHCSRINLYNANNGIYLYACSNFVIVNSTLSCVYAANTYNGIQIDSYCDGVELNSVNIQNFKYGVYMTNTAGGYNFPLSTIMVDVQSAAPWGTGSCGFYIIAGSGLMMSNCMGLSSVSHGCFLAGTVGGVVLSNCVFTNNNGYGLLIGTSGGVVINGGMASANSASNASFSASTATNILTLTTNASGVFALGQTLNGPGISGGTTIVSLASGSLGQIGSTYTLSTTPGTIAATTMNSNGTSNNNLYSGVGIATNNSNVAITGFYSGAYGYGASSQKYGLEVQSGCSNINIGNMTYGANMTANFIFASVAAISEVGVWAQSSGVNIQASVNTNETTLVGAGIGCMSLPANYFTVGKTITIKAKGFMNTNGAAQTLQFRTMLGSQVALTTGAVTLPSIPSALPIDIEIVIQCNVVGVSGVVRVTQKILYGTTGMTVQMFPTTPNALTFDTTQAYTLDLRAQWGSVSASNQLYIANLTVTALN